MLQHELETAILLARIAGKSILKHYADGFETEEKLGADNETEPVTVADRDASRIIVDGLAAAFPDDGILSEEEIDDLELRLSKDRVWIIDPIDGTAGFVKHDGDFGVQIGLAENGLAVLGVVFLPAHDLLSYAVKGRGSFMIHDGGEPVRVSVSSKTRFEEMTLAMSRNHPSPRMGRIIEYFGFTKSSKRGSVGLKVGLIADRTCDIYIHPSPRTKLWDTCAPQIILEEAGGRFTDLFGLEMRYDHADLQNRNGILATNGASHELAVERLKPLLTEFGRVPFKH
ncbi:MAG TPA: 3'(2'),5'-bisphosphate nucleotidase CysQ [Pyrinomonadaceae bacterium]|nr:3'(2'),5'-bisphosphate nucleotidase CysQ [Pyrinomonadaceae bacterium]